MNVSNRKKAFISLDEISQKIKNMLYSDGFFSIARKYITAFTRKRKLTVVIMVYT
jgi:hypothetical protein